VTLDEVRALVLAFPEAYEADDPLGVTFRVRTWFFTRVAQDGDSLVVTGVGYDERDFLVEVDPQTFHFEPRRKDHMVVLVRYASVEPATLKRLLEYRWRVAASKRAQRACDAQA
jgi:hypothetical protein